MHPESDEVTSAGALSLVTAKGGGCPIRSTTSMPTVTFGMQIDFRKVF